MVQSTVEGKISLCEARIHFEYIPETGILRRKIACHGLRKSSLIDCRSVNKNGYYQTTFRGKKIKAHVLSWVLYHGQNVPPGMIVDHRDGDRLNNRIDNLRLATFSQNSQNRSMHRNNKTGAKNVTYSEERGTYRVDVNCHGKRHTKVGIKTLEEAISLAENLRKTLHKDFAKCA